MVPTLSSLPFGKEIADGVADLLDRDGRILSGYCAHWMLKKGDRLVYEILKDARRDVFSTPHKNAFAAWLAQQSPQSLDDHVRPGCHDTIEVITLKLLDESVTHNA